MTVPPIAVGVGAGLVLALFLAPATGTALGRLAEARAGRVILADAVARAQAPTPPLVPTALAAPSPETLVAQIRERAKAGGVLVEEAAPQASGSLAVVRVRLSGPEKSVIALVDAIERGQPLVRLRGWRLAALTGGGVRLTGEAVAARR